jgi:NADPH-dependent curcumin reductase
MTGSSNRQIILISRPVGIPQPSHFQLISGSVPKPGADEILIENIFLSVDPAQRGYVNDENNYTPPVAIGAVMRALAVGRVAASNHPEYQVGEYLYGWFGWQDYCACGSGAVLRRVDPSQAPLSVAAGLLGINGLTAHMALHEIGAPKDGETVVVTAGAGAVGSIVGQLARLAGCRTVAIVGSDDKGAQCVAEFGYTDYVNYKGAWNDELRRACPGGIDVFFDNVGGELSDGVVRLMNPFGRVVICGTVAIPVWTPPPVGPRREREILTRRLRVQGFVIFDHVAKFNAVAMELAALLERGKIHISEDIETGLERAPSALVDVYAGRNRGKKLIRLRQEPRGTPHASLDVV